MDSVTRLFLEALRAALQRERVDWELALSPHDWQRLFRLAEEHHVLPMVYEAVFRCPAAEQGERELFQAVRRRTLQSVALQTGKTDAFLRLYGRLREAGVRACVVKGIVCRSLYPKPDYRMSGDEDVLIPAEQFRLCHEVLLCAGMSPKNGEAGIDEAFEVSYGKAGSPLYLELHKSLFAPDSESYGDLNRFFDRVTDRLTEFLVPGGEILTMPATDHLLYLILHALKHFLHSGFGIRQVCDICLFANAFGAKIDWQYLLRCCREVHGELFAAALFRIGERYLTFRPEEAHYPAEWRQLAVDEGPMLEDLLAGGAYGDSSMSRKHSSGITLSAVSAEKQGKKAGGHVLRTIFPRAKALEGRFPYLKKHPILLPVAWASRIVKYGWETGGKLEKEAAQSVQIGNRRIELLRQYGILRK